MISRSSVRKSYQYCELNLGDHSKAALLKRLITTVGYQYSGADTIRGLSGIRHAFDAIGTRKKNILLVVGGAETEALRKKDQWDPRARMEVWRNNALLSAYDVQAALQMEGLVVDLMFFHNINYTQAWVGPKFASQEWIEKNKLPHDISRSHTTSVYDIPLMSTDDLSTVAQSIGACFLSLDDLQIGEIALLTAASEARVPTEKIRNILLRRRLLQYFQPPTDELILSAYDFSKRHDRDLVTDITESADALGHPSVQNVLVPAANFRNAIETAKALEKHKFISYESRVEITQPGYTISQSIRKTAQGSLVVRILKSIGIGDLAKSIIEAIKGT
jgi:hypothetical protein